MAPLLQLSESELRPALDAARPRNANGAISTNHYVVLKRKVQIETWQKIQAAMTNLSFGLDEKQIARGREERSIATCGRRRSLSRSWMTSYGFIRTKPWRRTSWVMSAWTNARSTAARVLETSGKDGIERSFNSKLAGVRGWRVTETDRPGRELVAHARAGCRAP